MPNGTVDLSALQLIIIKYDNHRPINMHEKIGVTLFFCDVVFPSRPLFNKNDVGTTLLGRRKLSATSMRGRKKKEKKPWHRVNREKV